MTQPRAIFYQIMPSLGKDGAACVKWALAEWQRDLKGRVRFDAAGPGRPPNWQFEISEVETYPTHAAYCHATGKDSALIQFDPRVKWATTWFQRTFTSRACMQKLLLHEIGHALGLKHSKDPTSIMHPRPQLAEIDQASLSLLS